MINYFYSCDWGTTNLRLRLVDATTSAVLSDIETNQGITKVFSQWKLSDKDRFRFDLGGVEDAYAEMLRRITGEVLA